MRIKYLAIALASFAVVAVGLALVLAPKSPSESTATTSLDGLNLQSSTAQADSTDQDAFELGQTAMLEGRLIEPAGENALEYFLAADTPAARDAISELLPSATDLLVKAFESKNLPEAERVLSLLERADPGSSFLVQSRARLDTKKLELARRQAQLAVTTPDPQNLPPVQTPAPSQADAPTAPSETASTRLQPRDTAVAASAQRANSTGSEPRPNSTPDDRRTNPSARAAAPENLVASLAAVEPKRAPAARALPIVEAKIVSAPAPTYPRAARQQQLTGWVDLRIQVSSSGEVVSASVIESQPSQIFNSEALRAVKRWRFAPKTVGDEAVATTVRQRVLFNR